MVSEKSVYKIQNAIIARSLLVGNQPKDANGNDMEIDFLTQRHLMISKETNFSKLITKTLNEQFSKADALASPISLQEFESYLPCNRKGETNKKS